MTFVPNVIRVPSLRPTTTTAVRRVHPTWGQGDDGDTTDAKQEYEVQRSSGMASVGRGST